MNSKIATHAAPTLRGGVSGSYRMQVYKAGSDILVRDTGEMKNLITNYGLDRILAGGNGNDNIKYCQVGTGNTAPAATDTALATYLAVNNSVTTSNHGIGNESGHYYGYAWRRYRFNPGVATGNIQEVGIGHATNGSLISRALTVDESGTPTTVTVLADEYLEVTWTIKWFTWLGNQDPVDYTYRDSITLDGNSYPYVLQPHDVDYISTSAGATGWRTVGTNGEDFGLLDASSQGCYAFDTSGSLTVGAITAAIGVSGAYGTQARWYGGTGTYTTYHRSTFDMAIANFGSGIKYITAMGPRFSYAFIFDTPIPKTNVQQLQLTVAIQWANK